VDKRNEAGHYSGLNENKRSKSFLTPQTVEVLHTVNRHTASNNDDRIPHPRILACHQMWVQALAAGVLAAVV